MVGGPVEWEESGEQMTQAQLLLAGRETTDWPGHRGRGWVRRSCGEKARQQEKSLQPSVGNCSHLDRVQRPQDRRRGIECGMSQTQRCRRNCLPISVLWAPGASLLEISSDSLAPPGGSISKLWGSVCIFK